MLIIPTCNLSCYYLSCPYPIDLKTSEFPCYILLALYLVHSPDVLDSALIVIVLCAGKKSVKLEIYTEQRTKDGVRSAKQCLGSSGLELKLDELRKELSSAHGGILPHSVLSTEQIIQLASQKPNSLEQASSKLCSLVLCSCFDLYLN